LLNPDAQLPDGVSPRVRDWWREAGGKSPTPAPELLADASPAQVPPDAPQAQNQTLPEPHVETPAKQDLIARGVEAAPPARPRWGRWLALGLAAFGVVACAAGSVEGYQVSVLVRNQQNDAGLAAADADHARALTAAHQANALFITAAALGLLAGAFWIWSL
jgi:hypothetical protein